MEAQYHILLKLDQNMAHRTCISYVITFTGQRNQRGIERINLLVVWRETWYRNKHKL
jgi:hypothetical protein